MSPRRRYRTVEDWPPLKGRKFYLVLVKSIVDDKRKDIIDVVVENLDPSQRGRRHRFSLPWHVHPGNQSSLFLSACGLDASHTGTTFCVEEAVNVVVGVRFEKAAKAGDYAPADFVHIPKSDIGGIENGTSGTEGFSESDAANGSDLC